MATRSEQYKARAQRKGTTKKGAGKRRTKTEVESRKHSPANKRAGKKATYALEAGVKKRSRKSTRSSANRSKPDSALNAREENQKSTPTARQRKSAAKTTRVRGKPSA